ncbi:MAG: PCMD domain-containing protein [Bacteroidales bacterium]|nr:PCMD domain-containing protein [Bacteroidales bacterium]
MYRTILCCLVAVMITGCFDSGYFGLSDEANILAFDIEGQLSNQIVPGGKDDVGEVLITIPEILPVNQLKVTKVLCTQLAQFSMDPYSLSDFSQEIELTLTAENTKVHKQWRIKVVHGAASGQIPFSSFNIWMPAKKQDGSEITYKEDGVTKSAYFPGNGGISPWQTSAEANAFSLSGINTMTAGPQPSASNAAYARLETIHKSITNVVAGALFTGNFLFNMAYAPAIGTNEPRKMINLGTPFYAKPKAATMKLRYRPGDIMMDGNGEAITVANADGRPLQDSCEMYVLLHNRNTEQGTFIRVAAAHWRSGEHIGDMDDDASGFVEITVPFVYGEPDATTLAEKPYSKIGGQRGEMTFYQHPVSKESKPVKEIYASDPATTDVDHITVLFSSSVYGDFYWGGVNEAGSKFRGSTLDVKDFRLTY